MAQPKLKYFEFVDRYNAINLRDPASLPELESLAAEAFAHYESKKNLNCGFLAASCRFDLGFTEEALGFFEHHLGFVTKDWRNSASFTIYMHYARMLAFLDLHKEACQVLDFIFPALKVRAATASYLAIKIYGEDRQFDKVFELIEALEKAHPERSDFFTLPIMLEYYLEKDDKEGVVKCFFELVHNMRLDKVDLDNLGDVFDLLELLHLHPQLHPELTQREEKYLAQTHEIIEAYLLSEAGQAGETKVDLFIHAFENYGVVSDDLEDSSLLLINESHLDVILQICQGFRENLAAQDVAVEFVLDAVEGDSGLEMSLVVQPDQIDVDIYGLYFALADAHAQELLAILPNITVSADYSKRKVKTVA